MTRRVRALALVFVTAWVGFGEGSNDRLAGADVAWDRGDYPRALTEYLALLVNHFNPETLPGLMCRELLSVGHDGRLFDCDFNQALGLPPPGPERTIWDLDDLAVLAGRPVATALHCFGCTAGTGSSCGGALV